VERTLVIIKPDGVQRGLAGAIINRFERRGLRIAAMKLKQMPMELAEQLYAVHKGKHFYETLLQYITSGPVVVMVLEGRDVIEVVRRTMGATNPTQAVPGTIRADFALETGRNLVHGSDSPETAAYEIPIFFDDDEILSYSRDTDRWIFE
jgi:nucleoside-diphosphate kinase